MRHTHPTQSVQPPILVGKSVNGGAPVSIGTFKSSKLADAAIERETTTHGKRGETVRFSIY